MLNSFFRLKDIILLVLTVTMRELCHWPSIAGMSPQSNCGDEEDGCVVFMTSLYICIMLFALCLLSTLCVMNQFLF